jgi:hypothetical protein
MKQKMLLCKKYILIRKHTIINFTTILFYQKNSNDYFKDLLTYFLSYVLVSLI